MTEDRDLHLQVKFLFLSVPLDFSCNEQSPQYMEGRGDCFTQHGTAEEWREELKGGKTSKNPAQLILSGNQSTPLRQCMRVGQQDNGTTGKQDNGQLGK